MSNDIVERLDEEAAGYAEEGLSEISELLRSAKAEITDLRAERDAAARDMRERCAQLALQCSRKGNHTSGDDELYGDGWADCATYLLGGIRALPDGVFVIATEGNTNG